MASTTQAHLPALGEHQRDELEKQLRMIRAQFAHANGS